ncbi:MAG: hypothetical protein PHH59_01190 [Methylovulum sp.]|uniref:hypothetical protein n=1 Tax=Methylovulum sp. TaxID=1916980 RepID=UPI00262FE415|nr:hypothetical protein [Methylovulum sp.]MDD2722622.1 hypothetical protein [Methylovulum sp.]MDD5123779.1 hypothetical protein [Methylovulum sp.]
MQSTLQPPKTQQHPPISRLGKRNHCLGWAMVWIIPLLLLDTVDAASVIEKAIENNTTFLNPSGLSATFSKQGSIDLNNEFFQSLGSNGRACSTCHLPEEGWSITPAGVQQRFNDTGGTAPIFRTNDGSNSPKAKVSTLQARRIAYSLLLNKGVIRIGLKVPDEAEFELLDISDPYGFATAKDITPSFELSLFRRPLPASNLKFLSTVMWDGRETVSGRSMRYDLGKQANNATTGHAQGLPLTPLQRQHIVDFETALFTAQVYDKDAKALNVLGAEGGPVSLSKQGFCPGINDFLGDSKTGLPSDPLVFNLYDVWNGLIVTAPADIRAAIARGQRLFNTRPIAISGVSGLNEVSELGNLSVIRGTCSTCHESPNAGSHSVARFLNIGISDEVRRTADMPLYTLRNKMTAEMLKTTDPGRALITGQWQDVGRFKIPTLRGLAARAPYFHNGMAKELGDVVDFYDRRFQLGLDNRERLDLILFLRTL